MTSKFAVINVPNYSSSTFRD